MTVLGIEAKIVSRKKHYVVYIKEGSQIVDFLALTEANVSLMNLENIRILKEMRNNVNRKVNCEAANINKTVSAAVSRLRIFIIYRNRSDWIISPKGWRRLQRCDWNIRRRH